MCSTAGVSFEKLILIITDAGRSADTIYRGFSLMQFLNFVNCTILCRTSQGILLTYGFDGTWLVARNNGHSDFESRDYRIGCSQMKNKIIFTEVL
jgi:hypothetical protein